MSTSSRGSLALNKRLSKVQKNGDGSREGSRTRKHSISHNDAYLFALRVAYLAYLLQPRARRNAPAAGPPKPVVRSSSSIQDLMRDFSLIRDSKSTRFPHGFMKELEKRLTGVLMAKEKRQEYSDAAVKRTFAAAYNAFTEKNFKKSMEKDRRVEDLVLIFYSNATKELQKGKQAGDDAWKSMVDRHLALFVRLVGLILREEDWSKDRPELMSRLTTLENKLLTGDQDLAADATNGALGSEVPVPLSYDVKDMPLVQQVGRIFGLRNAMMQSDIDAHRNKWTEKEALQDLKTYQTLLNLDSRQTLRSDDFDLEEAYENWKRGEAPDLSQMMMAIVQANPELAKTTNVQNHQFSLVPLSADGNAEITHKAFDDIGDSSYIVDQPVDMSAINGSRQEDDNGVVDEAHAFTFIPPEPRSYYRLILSAALTHDIKDPNLAPSEATAEAPPIKMLSKQSTELLNEVCLRWRIPHVSRMMLFLDVVKEKFLDQELSLDDLDSAFMFTKEPPQENRKDHRGTISTLSDRTMWPMQDYVLIQQILSSLHDALLRDLYDIAIQCYEAKPPSAASLQYVLKHHIQEDPSFPKSAEQIIGFANQLQDGLRAKADEVYQGFLRKFLPKDQSQWEFQNVIELGQAVTNLAQKLQKRPKKVREIMGTNSLTAFVDSVLPLLAEDLRDIVAQVLQTSKESGEEVPIEDGFILYTELVKIRRVHQEALPKLAFAFKIEELLADFVWRWIRTTETSVNTWVENAVKQDQFQVRCEPGQVPTMDQRHSVSVIDIFSSFTQSIDKIVSLEWDDDLQYAKFMTALAKIVGAGIGRYCDIVEQRFTKEMDRPTPEQEAAVGQSRQEKWMQLAKEAWNNKEKVEPFQFFPESFVKLNNIEYATKQLDKIERESNVDACVDVIQRNTPPLSVKQRKISKYVFTIKIVEAEDLKPCDINGLSDPYVVLGDEYQKRLAKTRIIHGNLNPRWDESVDITTQGPLNLIATVWDWDQLGDHDCCGRTSIKLDPSHFNDFLPKEFWLDLDSQGRLLLRVSMEGERDDIQFYFGKAFRTLKRTERDMTRIITDKLSAYINHCLSRRALKSMLSRGISISTVSSYFNKNRPQPASQAPTQADVMNALMPLFNYFDDNFAIMKQILTDGAMITVMARLWKEVLVTLESLVVPPLSDKPSQQRQLNQQELDIVFKWLQLLYDFFHAVDEETGEPNGVPVDVLQSPKYFDLKTLNFFYFDPTDSLIRTSERMASATVARQQQNRNRLSAPAGLASLSFGGAAALMATPHRKSKSIMLSRNLGTMRKAKEEKRKEAQAEPNDDMILRILRMRPEAEKYLKDRSRQKERLAAAAAAELIVRQSILAGGGRMTSNLPRR